MGYFHLMPIGSEVTPGLETPVKRPDDPVLKAFDVIGYVLVYFGTPGRNKLSVDLEGVDREFTKKTNVVDCVLKVKSISSRWPPCYECPLWTVQ